MTIFSIRHCKCIGQFAVELSSCRCRSTTDQLPQALWALSGSAGSRLSWGRWQWLPTMAVGEPHRLVAWDARLANDHWDRLERMRRGLGQGCPLPRTPQMVGEAKEGGTNGARFHCQVAAQSIVLKYCELQYRAALGGPCSFAGPYLVCEAIATLEVMWKDI